MRARLVAAAICFAAGFACTAGALLPTLVWIPSARAIEASPAFRFLNLDKQVARWAPRADGQPRVVSYAVLQASYTRQAARNCSSMTPLMDALGASTVSLDTLRAELRAAFDTWEAIVPLRFVETLRVEDAGIVIGAQAVPRGRAFTNVELAARHVGGEPSIDSALICLNPRQRWKVGFDGDLDVYDLRYTFAHEIGHAIGLDHPGPSGQLMSFRYTEAFREPQAGDVSGARALYGSARKNIAHGAAGEARPSLGLAAN